MREHDGAIRSCRGAAAIFVLAGSAAWAGGAPVQELHTLLAHEVISQAQKPKPGAPEEDEGPDEEDQAKQPTKGAPQEAPKDGAKEPSKGATQEPVKEEGKEPVKKIAEEAAKEASKETAKAVSRADATLLEKLKVQMEKIQIGGAIEFDGAWHRDFNDVAGSDLKVTSAEFDFEANVVEWGRAELSMEWDGTADKVTVNEALVTIGKPGRFPLYLKLGKGVVPFGISSGATVAAKLEDKLTLTDPLTIAVFEGKQDFVMVGAQFLGFHAAAHVYNGRTNHRREKHLGHYGATLGYATRSGEQIALIAAVDLIDSVFDSDGLKEVLPGALTARYAPGISTHVKLGIFGFSFVAEYDTALRSTSFMREDESLDIRPSAWALEGGYTLPLFWGKRTYAGIGFSRSYELGGAFPEKRTLLTAGIWPAENFRVALEFRHDNDYTDAASGTGGTADVFTARLTYEW